MAMRRVQSVVYIF